MWTQKQLVRGDFLLVGLLVGFAFLFVPLMGVRVALAASQMLADGQLVAECVGWPTPHVELWWSSNSPSGYLSPNSNSVLRDVDGSGSRWFFGGIYPGVSGMRIDGSAATPWGPGGYPNPNYFVHDLRDATVQVGSTYAYRVKYRPEATSNTASITIDAAHCGGVSDSPTVANLPIAAGSITGACSWNNGAPFVEVRWSQSPPPGQGGATANALQRGDCFPGDPNSYWCFLANPPDQYAFTDAGLAPNTQYQYRVKYRSDLASVNTYSVYTSAANCGGPVPSAGPLTLSPAFQAVPPNVTAFFTATGGDGVYSWNIPGGSVVGSGSQVGAVFTNGSTAPAYRTVTVQSGGQTATAAIRVDGLATLVDDILLLGRGSRFLLINDDAPVAPSSKVMLTMSHGFAQEASATMTVKLGSSLAAAQAALEEPFAKSKAWDLCRGAAVDPCLSGLYTVYAIFTTPNGVTAVARDSIVYLPSSIGDIPAVTVNGGDVTTSSREVVISLAHGIASASDAGVTVQVANDPLKVLTAIPRRFVPAIGGWDLCDGVGAVCGNGAKTVFARFCAGTFCQPVVQDDILLESAWPDWGVRVNGDALFTSVASVQLQLNTWFDRVGTEMYVSNLPDLSDAVARPFSRSLAWNVCDGVVLCVSEQRTVYVRYLNLKELSWNDPLSPRYQDDIGLVSPSCRPRPVCLDATPACDPPEPVEGWCPASTCRPRPACLDAVPACDPPEPVEGWCPAPPTEVVGGLLINEGATRTERRAVRLGLESPFGSGADVAVRLVNARSLTLRDREVIKSVFGGGILGQSVQTRSTSPQLSSAVIPELESGVVRKMTDRITGWDLCDTDRECPYGEYTVYAQYYRRSGVPASGALGTLGDEVSSVYYDTIVYGAPTPTPSTPPTPSVSVGPSPSVLPVPTGNIVPGIGGVSVDAETAGVIGALSAVSAIAVGASAVAALAPLLASSGVQVLAFWWQSALGALGILPKRKKTWGTVYDSNTKRPIPFAKVQLLDRNKRVLEVRIADREGRYGFLTTPESLMEQSVQVALVASALNYRFPSRAQASVDTFIYNNLYYGDLVTVDDAVLISFDIPMDPEQPSRAPLVVKSPSVALGASVAALADAGFWLGLIMVPLNFVLMPNPFTLGTLFLFLGTASLRLWGIQEHPFGVVIDAATKSAMPFALITLDDMTGRRVAFAVSDERGRYFLVAPRGTYRMTAQTPASVVPPRRSTQTIDIAKGWITRSFAL
ncbi:MAG: carboxypeptidase regulatory-like domain-containing protein [Candidatus Yanofskybacteria bacterium]|nr:carboxypeptidase regulatory-like domain-containing protein [Candidatus Yanofskybacteria bacterium]